MTTEYPAIIERPKDIEPSALRPSMSGTAAVYAPNSAPLDTIGWLLLYGRALRYISETMRSKRDGLPDVAVWALFGPDGRAQACPFGRAKADIAQDCGEV